MPQNVVEKAGEHIAQSVREASRVTSAVADALEESVGAARRAAKQGSDAAEEFVNDTTKRIQRNPIVSVGTAVAAGFIAGILTALIVRRK